MNRVIMMAFLILAAAMVGILLINNTPQDTEVAAKTTRVGLLLNGSHEDKNYCQAHYKALKSLQEELNLEIVCRDNVPRDCYEEIVDLIQKEGCEIIVAVSFEFGESMEKAALEHPDICFLHATGTGYRNNLSTFFGRMYQARYLAGIVAGMQTKTGKLGYVSSFPVPEVVRGINAFALGARSVRPDADVYVRYCGSWTQDAPAEKACRGLLDSHPVDVVLVHTNSLQPHKEAEGRGVWSIGCNEDNAGAFPNTYLTSCVWRWDVYYRKVILSCLRGKFHGSHAWLGIDDGIVALSDFSGHVDGKTRDAVQAANERLQSREFDVFYGPIADNAGNPRIGAGESMSDDEMLHGFDWYVEGVTVEEQGVDEPGASNSAGDPHRDRNHRRDTEF